MEPFGVMVIPQTEANQIKDQCHVDGRDRMVAMKVQRSQDSITV